MMKSAQQWLTEAEELNFRVIGINQDDSTSATELIEFQVRNQLQTALEGVLLADLDYALERDVDTRLWNNCFKKCIDLFHAKLRKQRLEEDITMLTLFLNASLGALNQLLIKLCYRYRIPLDGFFVDRLFNRTSARCTATSRNRIVQFCLIHIGDICRYQREPKSASTFYRRAVSVDPSDGHGWNQLGIQATAAGCHLAAAYFYSRSLLASRRPFAPAATNLDKFYEHACGQQQTSDASGLDVGFSYEELFLQLHAHVHHCYDLQMAQRQIIGDIDDNTVPNFTNGTITPAKFLNMFGLNTMALKKAILDEELCSAETDGEGIKMFEKFLDEIDANLSADEAKIVKLLVHLSHTQLSGFISHVTNSCRQEHENIGRSLEGWLEALSLSLTWLTSTKMLSLLILAWPKRITDNSPSGGTAPFNLLLQFVQLLKLLTSYSKVKSWAAETECPNGLQATPSFDMTDLLVTGRTEAVDFVSRPSHSPITLDCILIKLQQLLAKSLPLLTSDRMVDMVDVGGEDGWQLYDQLVAAQQQGTSRLTSFYVEYVQSVGIGRRSSTEDVSTTRARSQPDEPSSVTATIGSPPSSVRSSPTRATTPRQARKTRVTPLLQLQKQKLELQKEQIGEEVGKQSAVVPLVDNTNGDKNTADSDTAHSRPGMLKGVKIPKQEETNATEKDTQPVGGEAQPQALSEGKLHTNRPPDVVTHPQPDLSHVPPRFRAQKLKMALTGGGAAARHLPPTPPPPSSPPPILYEHDMPMSPSPPPTTSTGAYFFPTPPPPFYGGRLPPPTTEVGLPSSSLLSRLILPTTTVASQQNASPPLEGATPDMSMFMRAPPRFPRTPGAQLPPRFCAERPPMFSQSFPLIPPSSSFMPPPPFVPRLPRAPSPPNPFAAPLWNTAVVNPPFDFQPWISGGSGPPIWQPPLDHEQPPISTSSPQRPPPGLSDVWPRHRSNLPQQRHSPPTVLMTTSMGRRMRSPSPPLFFHRPSAPAQRPQTPINATAEAQYAALNVRPSSGDGVDSYALFADESPARTEHWYSKWSVEDGSRSQL